LNFTSWRERGIPSHHEHAAFQTHMLLDLPLHTEHVGGIGQSGKLNGLYLS